MTIVDQDRSFWKSCVGVDATDLADRQNTVEESFCQYVIRLDQPLIVADARLDEVTRRNPSIEKMGVIAWAGSPFRSLAGHVLGTFCAVDTKVHHWTTDEIEILGTLTAAVEGESGCGPARSDRGSDGTVSCGCGCTNTSPISPR